MDHRYRLTNAFVHELPIGRGRAIGNNMPRVAYMPAGGWALDGIISLQSGYPITVRRTGDPGGMGTDGALRPDVACNPNIPRGQQTIERFFKPGATWRRKRLSRAMSVMEWRDVPPSQAPGLSART